MGRVNQSNKQDKEGHHDKYGDMGNGSFPFIEEVHEEEVKDRVEKDRRDDGLTRFFIDIGDYET